MLLQITPESALQFIVPITITPLQFNCECSVLRSGKGASVEMTLLTSFEVMTVFTLNAATGVVNKDFNNQNIRQNPVLNLRCLRGLLCWIELSIKRTLHKEEKEPDLTDIITYNKDSRINNSSNVSIRNRIVSLFSVCKCGHPYRFFVFVHVTLDSTDGTTMIFNYMYVLPVMRILYM